MILNDGGLFILFRGSDAVLPNQLRITRNVNPPFPTLPLPTPPSPYSYIDRLLAFMPPGAN